MSTKKKQQLPAAGNKPPSAQQRNSLSPEDTKLLNFVRAHAGQICAGITLAAAHEAERKNYGEMQWLNTTATQLGVLTGIQVTTPAPPSAPPRAMGASAGSGG